MPQSRTARKVFNWDVTVKGAWANEIEEMLKGIGAVDIFTNLKPVNILQVKEALMEMYKINWSEEIFHKPKLRTYTLIKSCYGTEKYV